MQGATVLVYVMIMSAMLAICTPSFSQAAEDGQPPVATLRLADEEMTPVTLVLASDIPAGTELRLRQERRLRPLWVGIYEVTNITVEGVSAPLPLREVPSFEDIRASWGRYEKSGQLAVVSVPVDLPAGSTLTVRGRRYDGIDLFRQRYTGRQSRVWLEPVGADLEKPAPVSEPLVVRTVSGPVEYLEAYRKPDGRLLIQAFDKADNPADTTDLRYKIIGEDEAVMEIAASPACEITEVSLTDALAKSAVIRVADREGRTCRAGSLPRGMDGRAIYFGDIHFHTDFSDGDYPIEDAIAWAHSRMGLDFTGPADHISHQGEFGGQTARDYVQFGHRFEVPGRFCRVPTFELGGAPGHTLLMARDYDTFVSVMDAYVAQVGSRELESADWCSAMTDIMIPGKTMLVAAHPLGYPARWPDIEDTSAFAGGEIVRGGAAHESAEAEPAWLGRGLESEDLSSMRFALSKGYALAFVGNSDNHRCLPGQRMEMYRGMTAVLTEALDTASVFDAIRQRRCYATSGARIVADATLNNEPIGSAIVMAARQPRAFKIMVRGTAPIAETQIIHSGAVLKTFPAPEDAFDVAIEWTDVPPADRETAKHEYYYVRVRQTDGHVAWLSPFWVQTPQA